MSHASLLSYRIWHYISHYIIHVYLVAIYKRSSAVAERPCDAPCRWKPCCHSRSLKLIWNYTVE